MIIGFAGEKVVDRAVVPPQGRDQRGRPSRTRSIYLREGKERTTSIVPAPAEKVVFDVEREAAVE